MEKLLEKYNSLTPEEMFKFNTMVDITFHSCNLEGAKLTNMSEKMKCTQN
ncbi:hypothetical protein LNQ49_06160 [Flavobacterium sp. F-65]|uniref:Uncharacterized protein n=1 Tax=Flavobacterium pisciphilum TaxID=2893755 RepID=A0ABS8MQZ9_9FLAO|nr:hypothetical protein [Flavobacterium sp. F-65]MCC9071176.1 hypothetical protein [Flavobacterium sp. F-65]